MLRSNMRILHRYIGYFAAGILVVYSISGVLLIYRDTDFLKQEHKYEVTLKPNLSEKELGKEIKFRNLEFINSNGDLRKFDNGIYNVKTGKAVYNKKQLPYILQQFTELHKSSSNKRFSLLNTFFGVSLFFFVISSFWMFNIKSKAFRKGMLYAVIGFILALIMVFFQ